AAFAPYYLGAIIAPGFPAFGIRAKVSVYRLLNMGRQIITKPFVQFHILSFFYKKIKYVNTNST
ncbi:MAG TPA: hypothetical protein PLO39_13290, partial [Saprospiraceae bacterium]|nr:hypothetical protein [Saprospiraceae bacterium]